MDWEKAEGWLAYFGLGAYLLFVASFLVGELAVYALIGFILICGTPLILLWAVSCFKLRGAKTFSAGMSKKLQVKVSRQVKDAEQVLEVRQQMPELLQKVDLKVEGENEESTIKALLKKMTGAS